MRRMLVALLILLVAACPTAMAEENLLVNGGFEAQLDAWPVDWRADMWLYDEGVSYLELRDGALDGQYCAMIENVASNDARFVQDVQVKPDTIYLFSGWIRAEGCDPNYAGASLSVIGTFASFPYIYETNGEWVYVQSYIRTSETQRSLTVGPRLGDYSADTTGKAFFDNLSFTLPGEIPADVDIIQLYDFTSDSQSSAAEASAEKNTNGGNSILFMAAFAALLLLLWILRVHGVPYPRAFFWLLMALAAALRLFLMATQPGYDTDMNCFFAWSARMAEVGPNQFYAPEYFCDYPPGYMYLLWLTGIGMRVFNVSGLDEMGRIIVKFVPLLADMATLWLLWRIARKHLGETAAVLLCALYAFSPAILVDGAIWGQVDSVVALGLLGTVILAVRGNWMAALPVFTLTVLMKPQALIAGPIGLVALVMDLFPWKQSGRKTARDAGLGLAISLAVAAAVLVPFLWGKEAPLAWIIEKYGSTLGSYSYATLNATNLFYLLGGNWVPLEEMLGPLSFGTWGMVLMVLVVGGLMALYALRRDRSLLPLFCAMIYIGIYLFGIKMHERYLFPAFALLLLAYVQRRDWRLLAMFAGFSATFYLNCAQVLRNTHLPTGFDPAGNALAIINLLLCAIGIWVALDKKVRPLPDIEPETRELTPLASLEEASEIPGEASDTAAPEADDPERILLPRKTLRRLQALQGTTAPMARMRPRDWLLMLGLTAVYAAIAFIGLGSPVAPQTAWMSTGIHEQVTFDLGSEQAFTILYYNGINSRDHRFDLEFSADGVTWDQWTQQSSLPGDCFRWQYVRDVVYDETGAVSGWTGDALLAHGRYVRMTADNPAMTIFEIVFRDMDGNAIAVQDVQSAGARAENANDPTLLVDEPQTAPEYPSYYNSTYFDEIYHARTGYEHAHGMSTYEWTHPPLGKVFIMIGIQLFGMTPFGWRFFGALMGVLMVPAMYMLGKLLFKKTHFAFLAAFVMAFDMMHLTQTRIATIDSYAVLFIILMYACMFRYMQMSFFRDGWRTLLPLGLSGLFMGLGCASKWICMYAAVGLAVLFFWTMVQRFLEWRAGVRAGGLWAERVRDFPKYAAVTLGACLLFFIVIPFAIYYFSYIPQFAFEGGLTWKRFWDTQTAIFGYHANLVDDHAFQSPWYEWPLMLKPMYYFDGKQYLPDGIVSTIMCMGNPAVWWIGFVAFLYVLWRWLWPHMRGRLVTDHRPAMLLIAFAAQFLPWVLVPRSMFIYHYFGSLPFVMLCIVYAFEHIYAANARAGKTLQASYMIIVAVLFVAFYPIATGIPIPRAWADAVNWLRFLKLPGWKFKGWLYY